MNPEEKLRELLERSVFKRCKADVEVGAFLSGGIDSSSISYNIRMKKNVFYYI